LKNFLEFCEEVKGNAGSFVLGSTHWKLRIWAITGSLHQKDAPVAEDFMEGLLSEMEPDIGITLLPM